MHEARGLKGSGERWRERDDKSDVLLGALRARTRCIRRFIFIFARTRSIAKSFSPCAASVSLSVAAVRDTETLVLFQTNQETMMDVLRSLRRFQTNVRRVVKTGHVS